MWKGWGVGESKGGRGSICMVEGKHKERNKKKAFKSVAPFLIPTVNFRLLSLGFVLFRTHSVLDRAKRCSAAFMTWL